MEFEGLQVALETIKTDVLTGIGIAAPVALGILGVFMAWRYAIKFFRNTSGTGR